MTMEPDTLDPKVRTAVVRAFVDLGRAPLVGEIARTLGCSPAEIEASFGRLHDAHMLVLAPGTSYLWMANPLSALPTPYAVHAGEKTFWGNCIWDALGILAMLGSDGDVTCTCPDCAEPLRLEVVDGGLVPSEHIVHFLVPARQWWDDIGFN